MGAPERSDRPRLNLQDALDSADPAFQPDRTTRLISGVSLLVGSGKVKVGIDNVNVEDVELLGDVLIDIQHLHRLVIANLSGAASAKLTVNVTGTLSELHVDGDFSVRVAVLGGQLGRIRIACRARELEIGNQADLSNLSLSGVVAEHVYIHNINRLYQGELVECDVHRAVLQDVGVQQLLRIQDCPPKAVQRPPSALRIERNTINPGAKVTVTTCKTKYLSLERSTVFENGTIVVNGVEAGIKNWARCQLLNGGTLEFVQTPLRGSFFAGTPLKQVVFGNRCWDFSRAGTTLAIDSALKGPPSAVPFLPSGEALDTWTNIPLANAIALNLECYRALISYFEERREFILAEYFHIGEMEMLRWRRGADRPSPILRWADRNVALLNLYRIFNSYGSSYTRAAFSILVSLLVYGALFLFAGLECPREQAATCSPIQYELRLRIPPEELPFDLARAVTFSIEAATLQKDASYTPATLTSRVLKALAPLIFGAEAALFVFALRRRLRRASLSG